MKDTHKFNTTDIQHGMQNYDISCFALTAIWIQDICLISTGKENNYLTFLKNINSALSDTYVFVVHTEFVLQSLLLRWGNCPESNI